MKEEFKEQLRSILVDKGLTDNEIQSFLYNNSHLYKYTIQEVKDKISVIFNGNNPYAIIFCDNNDLVWCTKHNGCFGELSKQNNNIDYIVQMIIGNAYRNKFDKFSNDSFGTLEGRMKTYRDISGGSPGYTVK